MHSKTERDKRPPCFTYLLNYLLCCLLTLSLGDNELLTIIIVCLSSDMTKITNTRLVGDVDYEEAKTVAKFCTPVPGGVGPMTVAMLMQNTIISAEGEATRILKMTWDLEVLPLKLREPVPRLV